MRKGNVTAEEVLKQPVTHHPLRDADIFPITDGSAAVVLAAGDLARWCRSGRRGSGASSIASRRTASACATSRIPSRPAPRASRPVSRNGNVDVAELHAQFSHEELILAEALGLDGAQTAINPSGGALAANPVMSAGLVRIGEVAQRITNGDAEPRRRPRDERSVPATEHGRRPGG